jgi:GTPase SAR1 family protein
VPRQLVAGNLIQKRKDGRVAVVGLYGVGGVGKTTLCKALCNHYEQDFYGRVQYMDFGSGDALAIQEEALRKLTNSRSDLILDELKYEVEVLIQSLFQ